MHDRLKRRFKLLAARRHAGFRREQRFFERSVRGRVARQIRNLLRFQFPVVLVTPRWSLEGRFLDDIAVDLGLGEPTILARPLNLAPLAGRSANDSWTWLAQAFVEFTNIRMGSPLWQAVDRHGFRHVLMEIFRRLSDGPRRCLLLHGVQHLHVEPRNDLLGAFDQYRKESGDDRRFNLLVAGSVDAPQFELTDAVRLQLPDFGGEESVEALVEYVGPSRPQTLDAAVRQLGGVPALIEAVGREFHRVADSLEDPKAILKSLGKAADEVRSAVNIVSAVPKLAERLERLGAKGPLPIDRELDARLLGAGLLRERGVGAKVTVELRAPIISQIAMES